MHLYLNNGFANPKKKTSQIKFAKLKCCEYFLEPKHKFNKLSENKINLKSNFI